MMLDLDYFKRINDTCGHLYGDYILKTVSEIFIQTVGSRGYVGRFGGEEFIIILPGAGIAEAACIGEKIRSDIFHHHYGAPGQDQETEPLQITVSIGITQHGGEPSLALLKKADDLLYKANQDGRNRLAIC
jgi:diguanylate cyclase (GGDEF)-like protein